MIKYLYAIFEVNFIVQTILLNYSNYDYYLQEIKIVQKIIVLRNNYTVYGLSTENSKKLIKNFWCYIQQYNAHTTI